jgi:16S rRNA (guanine527-N7)-methyltransferase
MTGATLAVGVRELGLGLDAGIQDRLIAYRDLLHKWNRSFNLTAVRDPEAMVVMHLLDSLAVIPFLGDRDRPRMIDIGTGAGLPGIPLAIACPERQWVLLDSNHKKTTFLRQAAAELELDNVEVIVARVETFTSPRLFDVAISRAFSSLDTFVAAAMRLLTPIGRALAMKGTAPLAEANALVRNGYVVDIDRLTVPLLSAQRCLVTVTRPT